MDRLKLCSSMLELLETDEPDSPEWGSTYLTIVVPLRCGSVSCGPVGPVLVLSGLGWSWSWSSWSSLYVLPLTYGGCDIPVVQWLARRGGDT